MDAELTSDDARRAAHRRGLRDVVLASILWSLSGIFTKFIDLDSQSIAVYRGLFAGLTLLPFVPRSRWAFRWQMLPMFLVFGAMTGMYLAAVKLTTAANAILLQCTATFWMVPLSFLLLREKPDLRVAFGIGLATLGVGIIVTQGRNGQPGEGLGIVLGLASGVAYAIVATGLRGFRDLDPVWLSGINNLGGAAALSLWIWGQGGTIPLPSSAGQAGMLVVFGAVQMAIPYALFARGLRVLSAPEAGLLGLLEPILNPIWVALFHGEVPAGATIKGGAFLLSGLVCRYLPTPASWKRVATVASESAGPFPPAD